MKLPWLRLIVPVMLLLLGACSTAPTQQQETAPSVTFADPDPRCHDINGRYNARPHQVADVPADKRPLLAQTLLPANVRLSLAHSVEVQMSNAGVLHLFAYDERGTLILKHHYSPDSGVFECDDGQMRFHPLLLGETPPAGIDWEELVLRRTEDGSLMLRKGGLFSGMVFLIFPMGVTTDNWYLFKPVP